MTELASNIQQRIVTFFEHLDVQIPAIDQRNFVYSTPWALEIYLHTQSIYLQIIKKDEDVFVSVIWMPRDESECAYFPA